MNLIRLIVIALIIYLFYRMYKSWSINKNLSSERRKELAKNIVACKICSLHIPENEAISLDGKYFCSKLHLEQYNSDNQTD